MMAELEKSLAQANAAAGPGVATATAAQDAQALVAKAWTAGWPLVAMWPFLYASFLLEQNLGLG